MATTTPTPLVSSTSSNRHRCPYPHRHLHLHSPGGKPNKPGALPPPHSLRATSAAPLAPLPRRRRDVSAAYGDGDMDDDFGDFDADDADGVGDDDDVDNEVDYDVDYDRLLAPVVAGFPPPRGPAGEEEGDIAMMYVTPPDTGVYSIPRVLAPMPQKVPIAVSVMSYFC
ncbi:hypothetical protein BAE44_0007407 [Dichanthelium oligosanthes]|uniref:Uncharacterized protein n=1 Tax=Dichanthelium oligosanthes TaxID=888268 RepID=A0A1E5W2H7_9POAL|nr:hypothetical protein BAE44_0007407 [Dichanthelium oligosanthes]